MLAAADGSWMLVVTRSAKMAPVFPARKAACAFQQMIWQRSGSFC